MDYIKETLQTPVAGSYDVVVCGGGPAGVCAAIGAARCGASVLLVEEQWSLGGMWTGGFVNPLFDYANKDGLMNEIVDTLKERGEWGGFWNKSFNYEYMRAILEEKCTGAGVDLLYGTRAVDIIKDDNRVTGIITENTDGRKAYLASCTIDATGNAHIAAKAGAAFQLGNEDGDCQAMTLMFLVANIPEDYIKGKMVYEELNDAFTAAGKPERVPFKVPYLIPVPNTHFGVFQLTHMRGYNPLSARELTNATMEGRAQVIEVFEAFKRYCPAFTGLELISSAPLLGVRETRRIEGEYTLVAEDLAEGRKFEDGITTVTFGVDIHVSRGTEQKCWPVKPYQIPFRCLIPRGLEGLLVAGKTISGSHEAMASYRVTGNCAAMGEAAGFAAYEAVKQNKSVRDVTINEIFSHKQ